MAWLHRENPPRSEKVQVLKLYRVRQVLDTVVEIPLGVPDDVDSILELARKQDEWRPGGPSTIDWIGHHIRLIGGSNAT